VKKLSLELGGNAPFIVFDDADLDAAVQGAIASKYRNTGQTCVCANRLLVQEGVYDAFVAKLVAAVQQLRVGDGLQGATEQGPLIDEKAVAKVEEHVADAVAQGGRRRARRQAARAGRHVLRADDHHRVKPSMLVAREETFGPWRRCSRFKDEAEAIRMANDTEFGLASISTRATSRARGAWPRRSSTASSGSTPGSSRPRWRRSAAQGIRHGREGSKYGILDYTELKYLCIGGIEG
jgi:succinate-semialdehyde dehydrogenase / glutarate-semialdehyde dehydrogenase